VQRVMIFDTTLRDGEQSPGVSLSVEEKLEIARQLARMKVDVIEAGFPITSQGDFEAVRAIAQEIEGPIIAALARSTEVDIRRAWEAVSPAARPRIHTFVSTSEIHMKYMLRKEPAQVLKMSVEAVRLARELCPDVEFSAQDATRSDPEFLYRLIEAVIEAGATTINIADTVGYTMPGEFYKLIAGIRTNVPNIHRAVISVHCHNDLGMATANSLAAVEAGARQIECAVNGIGERAGNTALEEVVMALATRHDYYGVQTGIVTEQIARTSHLVSTFAGMPVQPNKAIVGSNAFAHESGIHQDGVLKRPETYEIMKPESIGLAKGRLVLGKHSGRHAFRDKLAEMGYNLSELDVDSLFIRFKALADRKKEITDRDIQAIVEDTLYKAEEVYRLGAFQVSSGNNSLPMATIVLEKGKESIRHAASGDGPVDAVYKAIDGAVGISYRLVDYSLKAVTSGKDALGEATVRLERNGRVFLGRGVSIDIIEASALAYINAINKMASQVEAHLPAPTSSGQKGDDAVMG